MRAYLIGSAIAVLGLATAAAAAQTPPPPGVAQGTGPAPMAAHPPLPPVAPLPPMVAPPHVRVMSGGDHVTTRAEVIEHVGKMFAKLDTNHDGFVTREEVDALHAKIEAAMAKVDGLPKRLAESGVMMGDRGQIFDQLDTNHDGNISRQEFMARKPQVREERVIVMRDGPAGAAGAAGAPLPSLEGHPGMMRMHMHMAGMGLLGGQLSEMADANRDGRVSLAEAQAAALAHFDKADLNHDGKITPEERAQGHRVRVERIERHES